MIGGIEEDVSGSSFTPIQELDEVERVYARSGRQRGGVEENGRAKLVLRERLTKTSQPFIRKF